MVRCPVCSDPVLAEATGAACETCGAPHHRDCWDYAGGCTTYGCGGTRRTALAALPGPAGPLVIAEPGAPPARPAGAVVAGLVRWAGKRAGSWVATVPAGLVGSALVLMGMPLIGVGRPDPEAMLTFALIGLCHGLVAPFFAPAQHRRPWTTGALALAVLALTAYAAGERPYPFGWVRIMLMGIWTSSAAIASASLADALIGPRSRVGVRFGPFSALTRAPLAFVLGIGAWYGFTCVTGARIGGPSELLSLALLAAMGTACGFPALERGKALYLESLPPARR